MKYTIKQSSPEDAPLIAKAIGMALEIDIYDGSDDAEWCRKIFGILASRDDSQYSYRNTLKAVTSDGRAIGFLVNYDGAMLHTLREAFFEVVKECTGEDLRGISDETDPDEWYLDSLAVWPEYRHLGIGSALIKAGISNAKAAGKPAGLLVDKDNIEAQKMYESHGFKYVDDRQFAGRMMNHMRVNGYNRG